jgi:hypothetical protein
MRTLWLSALLVLVLAPACGDDDDTQMSDLAVTTDLAHDGAMCSKLSSIDGGTPASCPPCSPLSSGACTTPLSCGSCTGDNMCRYGDGTVCSCVGDVLHCGAASSR